MSKLKHSGVRSGLTLLELVIVMVILAALTGIAVRAIEPVADQARYEQTLKSLEQIEQAYLLRTLGPDSTVSYHGFIADIGRLPVAIGTNPQTQLSELWDPVVGGLPPFRVDGFDDLEIDGNEMIPVAAGWRGPYLNLPPGPAVLRDGFGNDLALLTADDDGNVTAAVVGAEIAGVTSLGANNVLDPLDVDYDRDVSLPLWLAERFEGALPVSVIDSESMLANGETMRVRIYGPVSGAPGLLNPDDDEDVAAHTGNDEYNILLEDITCGPRVVWAVVTTGAAPTLQVVRQSAFKQIMVSPGMNATITMRIN